ncbi:hypothetical protein FHS82_001079 [Pseudochelatococcus lubricantis]|uniref:Uncharacterized protein n=1 Tax=Pseudochelatococcus lubricantis TaxID=1538102 RepID=A0ABX0UXY1_9HYPH|nr:hypothetical protein [Pseudochelatococcus lubricantis]NIJ57253.1 hypothetical protein [Pseudochelatococcus lubricantis]
MADSDITVATLTAAQAGPGAILVTPVTTGGSCLPYMALDAVEIWASTTNSRGSSIKVGDTVLGFIHADLPANTTRYYWARARDVSDNNGDWYPASATAGISATTTSADVADGSITENKLANGAVTENKVGNGAVTTTKIANLAITTAKIGDAQITQTKIGNAAIVNAHLGNAIIAEANIQNAAITNAKIASLTADKVSAGTFTGLTFRTAATGTRVEISADTNDITAYVSGGQASLGGTDNVGLRISNSTGNGLIVRAKSVTENAPASMFEGTATNGPAVGIYSVGQLTGHALRCTTRLNASSGDSLGGQAIVGVAQGGGGHAVYAEKGSFAPFTGSHDAFIAKDEPTEIGDIVCDLKVIARSGVDDTVTEVYVAEDDADPAAVGVVSRRLPFEPASLIGGLPQAEGTTRLREILAERYDRLAINSVGEGQVNVCGRGGDIRAGDLIMTSTLRGKGQRQPDGIMRAYTVAKARESVTFSGADDWKRVSCIYLCG